MIGDVIFFNKSTGEQIRTTTTKIEVVTMVNYMRKFGIESNDCLTAFRCGAICADMGRAISHLKTIPELRTVYDYQVIENLVSLYSELLGREFTEESLKEFVAQVGETFYDDDNVIVLNME